MLDSATLKTFRQCLADHIGKTLTQELCQILDRVIRFGPDCAIQLDQFEALAYGVYTLGVERLASILPELEPLHAAHWLETEKHRHGLEMRPDYDAMIARERAGRLLQFTVREQSGALIGHLRMYLGVSLHTQTLFAEEDTLYLSPQHRGSMLAIHLMRYAERALCQVGAREIRADSKLINKADVLMRRLGYKPVALKFHKFFED